MKKLIIRAASGSVYVALIFAAVLLGDYALVAIFGLFALLAILEFNKLVKPKVPNKLHLVLDVLGSLSIYGAISSFICFNQFVVTEICIVTLIAYFIVRLIAQLYDTKENPIQSISLSFLSIIYTAIPLALISCIKDMYGSEVLFSIFILIWLNDTGAFLVGSAIGKRRLFERISPKKSWEGFFGGLILCIVFACVNANFIMTDINIMHSLCWYIGLGAVVSIFATWGDLVESLFKRTLNVKDSGNLIPGHGGILDRIDSILVVMPAALVYMLIYDLIK